MALLNVAVDKTAVNYTQTFDITLNAGFSGIEGDIADAEIRLIFPSYIDVTPGVFGKPVQSVDSVAVPEGTLITFRFGRITDLGVSVQLSLSAQFTPDAENFTEFICEVSLYIDGVSTLVAQALPVKLEAVAIFVFKHEIILPQVGPSPGSEIYYKVTLENIKDLGVSISDVVFNLPGTEDITIDTEFAIVGKDVSSSFADKSADGIIGAVVDNEVLFNIPTYRGQKYEFIYKAVIGTSRGVGEELSTVATLNFDGEAQQNHENKITLTMPIYNPSLWLYGPDYTLPDEYICYKYRVENNGNRVMSDCGFTITIPAEVDIYRFTTGTFYIAAIKEDVSFEYTIGYTTVGGATGTLGPYNTAVNNVVNAEQFVQTGDAVATLTWNIAVFGIGVKHRNTALMFGTVKSDTLLQSTLTCDLLVDYQKQEDEPAQASRETTCIVEDICVLRPKLTTSVGDANLRPGDKFRYNINVNCTSSRLKNPIVAVLLPSELLYNGDVNFGYSDIFGAINPTLPPAEVVADFTESAQTLVKFEFSGEYAFAFRQTAVLNISFEVTVAVGALGTVSAFAILNTGMSTGFIPGSGAVFDDIYGVTDTQVSSNGYAKSNIRSNTVIFFVSVSSDKKIKGALDDVYIEEPSVARTYEGGKLQYLITLKNTGNATLTDIELIDILPHVGDTGVIQTASARNSEFPVYNISEIAASVMPQGTDVGMLISYSTDKNPKRFGGNFNTIGDVDDWQAELPDDSTELRAFRVSAPGLLLAPAQSLQVLVNAVVPVGVTEGQVAWNTFAADVAYFDEQDTKKRLLAVEPEKVGVSIRLPNEDTVRIGGSVWHDANADGYCTQDEPFVNDIGVALLDQDLQFVDAVFTTPNISGEQGNFLFSNLPQGKYYLKFYIDTAKHKFTRVRSGGDNTSAANPKTGLTAPIDLTGEPTQVYLKVGIMDKSIFSIDTIMKINNDARRMVRDVIKNQMLIVMKQENLLEIIEDAPRSQQNP